MELDRNYVCSNEKQLIEQLQQKGIEFTDYSIEKIARGYVISKYTYETQHYKICLSFSVANSVMCVSTPKKGKSKRSKTVYHGWNYRNCLNVLEVLK